jgi:hypothetical protein
MFEIIGLHFWEAIKYGDDMTLFVGYCNQVGAYESISA